MSDSVSRPGDQYPACPVFRSNRRSDPACRRIPGRGGTSWPARALLALILVAHAFALCAEPGGRAPPGLVWNRSGLPAVFPLQVKTAPGRDYRLTLIDADSGKPQMAANIHGGTFFRILVPPGSFTLQFDSGPQWQGETARFGTGPESGRLVLADPLTFEIRRGSTRAGHLLDLTDIDPASGQPAIRPQRICQGLRYEPDRRHFPPGIAREVFEPDSEASRLARDPRRAFRRDIPGLPEEWGLPYYRMEVRSRYCD